MKNVQIANVIPVSPIRDLQTTTEDTKIKSLSHDLRNYLFGISGLADIILNNDDTKEVQEQYLNIIIQQSQAAADLISEILDL